MFIFFIWVAWFILLFRVIGDIFRRRDIGGGGKVLWMIFVVAVPFLGVFVYLIANNNDMADRDTKQAQAAQHQFDNYVKTVAASDSAATQIEKANQLLDSGAITQPEFEAIKAKALA